MDERNARLLAATALLSGNPTLLRQATDVAVEGLDDEVRTALEEATDREVSGPSRLMRIANVLPAPVQFVAQRLVLVSPRLARAILRRTGLHHQLY